MLGPDNLIAELVLQVAGLKSEISELKEIVTKSPSFVEGWATAKDAAAALRNEGVKNAAHLKRLRLEGAFIEGREIRNITRKSRPTWEYHIPSCRKALHRYFKTLG